MSPVRIRGAAPVPEAPVEGDHEEVAGTAQPSPPAPDRRWLAVAVATGVLALPFGVAAVALRRPQYFPVLDLAMTEFRLRDVGTGDTPLIGLPGRIGPSIVEQGSHPGPLSFYVLAPLYRLFGSSAWAMLAATAVVNIGAMAAALAVAARRGGWRMVVAVAAVLALLVPGYGLTVLTQPWNPYLPLLWWLVFLLAVWSVVCDDVAILPVVVATGTWCAQTHVPYAGLAGGLGLLAVGATVLRWRRAAEDPDERRRVVRWAAGAAALAMVLWLPPLIDQATEDPGNLRAIYDHLVASSSSDEEPVGFGRATQLTLNHLDVTRLVSAGASADGQVLDGTDDLADAPLPGLLMLAAWALAVVVAVRHGPSALVRLHLVVGVGLVLGLVAIARILGREWYYLMLWAWGLLALMLLAVGWSALVAVRARLEAERRRRVTDGVALALGALAAVSALALVVAAVDVDPPEAHLSEALGAVVPDTIAALERGDGAATGADGRYVVMWDDAAHFGSQGYGLVSELERAGLDARTNPFWHVPVTDHRVRELDEASATVHLATGVYVERWREVPGAVEVAFVEPRDDREMAEFDQLRAAVIDDLRAEGLDDLVPQVDTNVFGLSIDDRISGEAEDMLARMLVLGQQTAVFVTAPEVTL